MQTRPQSPLDRFQSDSRIDNHFLRETLPKSQRFQLALQELLPAQQRMLEDLKELRQALNRSFDEYRRPITSIEKSFSTEDSIQIYRKLRMQINARLRDWRRFLEGLIQVRANVIGLAIDRESFREHAESWKQEVSSTSGIQTIMLPADLVTSEFSALPNDTVKNAIVKQLNGFLEGIAERLCSQLLVMAEKEVIGYVSWHGPNTCEYVRYERVCDFNTRSRTIKRRWDESTWQNTWDGRYLQKTENTEWEIKHSGSRKLVRTIEHLINASERKWDENGVVIPRRIMPLLDSIPEWIKPSLKVVEGTLMRELIIEQDLEDIEQLSTETTAVHTIEDIEKWEDDPALVVGPFVLAGWSDAEVQKELQLRNWKDVSANESKDILHEIDRDRFLVGSGIAFSLANAVALSGVSIPKLASVILLAALACWLVVLSRKSAKRPTKNSGVEVLGKDLVVWLPALICLSVIGASFLCAHGMLLASCIAYSLGVCLILVFADLTFRQSSV